MKTIGENYDAIHEKAGSDGQFAIAWAICQLAIEVKEIRRGLVGDFSMPGLLPTDDTHRRLAVAVEAVASSISEVAQELG